MCLDGHPDPVMNRDALIWVSTTGQEERYSFRQLSEESNRFANVLTELGIKKGDRVFLFLERIPELYIAMFGALKIGAIVGPLFSAFGPEAIEDRLSNAEAVLLLTSPTLKPRVDKIREKLPHLKHVNRL